MPRDSANSHTQAQLAVHVHDEPDGASPLGEPDGASPRAAESDAGFSWAEQLAVWLLLLVVGAWLLHATGVALSPDPEPPVSAPLSEGGLVLSSWEAVPRGALGFVPRVPTPKLAPLDPLQPCRYVNLDDPVAALAFFSRDGRRPVSLQRPLVNSLFDMSYVANFLSWLRLVQSGGVVAPEDLVLMALDNTTAAYLEQAGLGEVCMRYQVPVLSASPWLNAGLSKMRLLRAIVAAGYASLHIEQDVLLFPQRVPELLLRDTFGNDVVCVFYRQTDDSNHCNLGFFFTSAHPSSLRLLTHVVERQTANVQAWDQALVNWWLRDNLAESGLRVHRLMVDDDTRRAGAPMEPFAFESAYMPLGEETESAHSFAAAMLSPRQERMLTHMVGNPSFTRRWLMDCMGVNNWRRTAISLDALNAGVSATTSASETPASESSVPPSPPNATSARFIWLRRPLHLQLSPQSRRLIQLLVALGSASGRRVILPTFEVPPEEAPLNFACQPTWPPPDPTRPLGLFNASDGDSHGHSTGLSSRRRLCLRPYWRLYRLGALLEAGVSFAPASLLFTDNEDARHLRLHDADQRAVLPLVLEGEGASPPANASAAQAGSGSGSGSGSGFGSPAPAARVLSFESLLTAVRGVAAPLLVLDVDSSWSGSIGIGIDVEPDPASARPAALAPSPQLPLPLPLLRASLPDLLSSAPAALKGKIESAAALCRGYSRGSMFCQ